MGYVWAQGIADGLTLVGSDEGCSLHINGKELEETKIIRLTDEQFKIMLGCWLSEAEGKHSINDIAVYTNRVMELEMLLSDAQYLLEEREKVATDEEELRDLREWLQKHRDLHKREA